MTNIEKVTAEVVGDKLVCEILLDEGNQEGGEFAFYVYRNEQRIHTAWYSKYAIFEFDLAGIPGYYRVVGFAKSPDGATDSAKSAPLFLSPLEVGIGEFPEAESDKVAYILRGPHWRIPALYYPSSSNWLFVMMPSAVDSSRTVRPVFSRWTWATQNVFPGHVLCIADPTLELNKELRLGWCLGTGPHCLTDELANFLIKFADVKGISRKNIVIWGSSAGGFAALALAARIADSTAVAINAQTDALCYESSKQVSLVCRYCFGTELAEEIRKDFTDRIDMTALWSKTRTARAIMVQNELDVHHYEVHFKPFWKSLGGTVQHGVSSAGIHRSWVYTDDGGHVPETPEMARQIIDMLALEELR